MLFVKRGTPIRQWTMDRAHVDGIVKTLASDNGLTVAAVYNYINSRRDIRVYNGEIFEIKQLRGKG